MPTLDELLDQTTAPAAQKSTLDDYLSQVADPVSKKWNPADRAALSQEIAAREDANKVGFVENFGRQAAKGLSGITELEMRAAYPIAAGLDYATKAVSGYDPGMRNAADSLADQRNQLSVQPEESTTTAGEIGGLLGEQVAPLATLPLGAAAIPARAATTAVEMSPTIVGALKSLAPAMQEGVIAMQPAAALAGQDTLDQGGTVQQALTQQAIAGLSGALPGAVESGLPSIVGRVASRAAQSAALAIPQSAVMRQVGELANGDQVTPFNPTQDIIGSLPQVVLGAISGGRTGAAAHSEANGLPATAEALRQQAREVVDQRQKNLLDELLVQTKEPAAHPDQDLIAERNRLTVEELPKHEDGTNGQARVQQQISDLDAKITENARSRPIFVDPENAGKGITLLPKENETTVNPADAVLAPEEQSTQQQTPVITGEAKAIAEPPVAPDVSGVETPVDEVVAAPENKGVNYTNDAAVVMEQPIAESAPEGILETPKPVEEKPKTRLDLILDGVDKHGEVTLKLDRKLEREEINQVEKTASDRGISAFYDGHNFLFKKKILESPETTTTQPETPNGNQTTKETGENVSPTAEEVNVGTDLAPKDEENPLNVSGEEPVTPVIENENVEVPSQGVPADDPKNQNFGPGAANTNEFAPPGTTSVKNAVVDQERIARGLEPLEPVAKRSHGVVWDQAMAALDADPQRGKRLVEELRETPRAVSDLETAILDHERLDRKAELYSALDAVNNAENDVDRENAKLRRDRAINEANAVDEAGKVSGTETARGLAFRRRLVQEDYTLGAILKKVQAIINDGGELSEKQITEATATAKRIADLEAKLEEVQAAKSNEQLNKYFNQLLKDEKKATATAAKSGKGLVTVFEEAAQRAREREKARRAEGRLNANFDPEQILDQAIIGASYIAKGVAKGADFTAAMVKEFGEKIRPIIEDVYNRAKQYHDNQVKGYADNSEATPASIVAATSKDEPLAPKTVFDLARSYVRSGITDLDGVMQNVTKDLKEIYPELTEREVRDAFSGYGKVKYPSKEADLAKLRELKNLGRLASSIEDVKSGRPPKRTGLQRDQPTQEVREKTKELIQLLKESGIEVTSPEAQLKSALDAVKTRLRNAIEDAEKQLATGSKTAKKGSVEYDAEANALKARLDDLRSQLEDVNGRPELTDEQRIKIATASAEKQISELDLRIQNEELTTPKRTSKTPVTPELEALRAERDAMRDHLNDMRDAANPSKTPEQRALESAEKAVQKSIERYDEMLKSGNLTPAERAAKFTPTYALQTKMAERDAMRDAVRELRKETSPKTPREERLRKQAIKSLDKSIAEYDRRLREGDFSDKPIKISPTIHLDDVQTLKAQRNSMKNLYEELKKAGKTTRTPEEIQLDRYKKALATRTKQLQEKMDRGDFEKKTRKELELDDEALKLQYEDQKVKEAYNEKFAEHKRSLRSKGQKIYDNTKEGINLSRSLLTGGEFSAVLRQGGFLSFSHPIMAAKSLPAMFRAFRSKEGAFRVEQEIKKRENFPLYKQSGLYLAEDGTSLSKMEEAYLSRYGKLIPFIAGSERAYTAFLNKLRADSFDVMEKSLSASGKLTEEEAKLIANFINIATGRGDLGKFSVAGEALSTAFFAPRYAVSRFQLLTGQPLRKAGKNAGRARKLIAKEYARTMIGYATIASLALAAGATIETDPRSSDFLKLKFGDTRVDMLFGLSQSAVFLAKILSGETKNGDEIKTLRPWAWSRPANLFRDKNDPLNTNTKHGYKEATARNTVWNFIQSKAAPAPGYVLDMLSGENMLGQPIDPKSRALDLVIPLTYGDIYQAIKTEGIPAGTAYGLAAMFGAGLQTYAKKTAAQKAPQATVPLQYNNGSGMQTVPSPFR